MEPAQALADLVEISSQIEAVVLLDASGAVVATTLADADRAAALAGTAQAILARADEAAGSSREAAQVEVSLLDGSVFVVRSDGRVIVATTRPDPTVGLVLYDLRSCLRNAAAAPEKPARSRARTKKQPAPQTDGGDDAAA